jgi:hypothetical protein
MRQAVIRCMNGSIGQDELTYDSCLRFRTMPAETAMLPNSVNL